MMRKAILAVLLLITPALMAQTKIDLSSQAKGVLSISQGGTGASDAATARANLGASAAVSSFTALLDRFVLNQVYVCPIDGQIIKRVAGVMTCAADATSAGGGSGVSTFNGASGDISYAPAISEVTGLTAALAGKQVAGSYESTLTFNAPLSRAINAISIDLSAYATVASLSAHTSNTSNPHSVSKSQVGLANVDNTSDASKPVSTAQATAIALKEPALGNPGANGYLLSSTTGGARSWTAVTREFVFAVGCDTCSALLDTDDQKNVLPNRLGVLAIQEVGCISDAGTPTIQLQKNDGTPANILASSLTCTTSGAYTTSFVAGENVLAFGDKVDYQTISAGGAAHGVTVTVVLK